MQTAQPTKPKYALLYKSKGRYVALMAGEPYKHVELGAKTREEAKARLEAQKGPVIWL